VAPVRSCNVVLSSLIRSMLLCMGVQVGSSSTIVLRGGPDPVMVQGSELGGMVKRQPSYELAFGRFCGLDLGSANVCRLARKRGQLIVGRMVAVIDDEPDLVELVTVHLKKAGYEPRGFTDPQAFLKFLRGETPDLVLLDLMLPDMDGMEICKYMKSDGRLSPVPIIILSARSDETDKVLGLELGADDYVTKPFSPRELIARVKAVLRRNQAAEETRPVSIGNKLRLDPERHEVEVYGKKVDITTTEFRILALLASRSGRVFSRDEILDHLWGHEKAVLDRTVDVHIRHLRKKMGRGAGLIKNVRGVGYKFEG
jgi:DNA-binding response OmpR family regulator